MSGRLRAPSPGSRRLAHGHPYRSSTGGISTADYDPYDPLRSREAGPRTSLDRIAGPRIMSRGAEELLPSRRLHDSSSPRRLTLDSDGRRPLSSLLSSTNRYRPVVTDALSPVKTRLREDEPAHIQPASSSNRDHHRTYSVDSRDMGRHLAVERPRHQPAYTTIGRQPKERYQEGSGWEYTDRKEQVYRDTAPMPRQRRESLDGRRERPLSMTGLENVLPRVHRDSGPPVTTRGFDKIDRPTSTRTEYRVSDFPTVKSRDDPDTGKRSSRVVALHQDPEDRGDKYRHRSRRDSSLDRNDHSITSRGYDDEARRDEEKSRRRREPHEEKKDDRDLRRHKEDDRSRREDDRKERSHRHKEELGLGVGAAAIAGMAVEGIKKHRDRDGKKGDRREAIESSDPSGTEEEQRERRRLRRKEREREAKSGDDEHHRREEKDKNEEDGVRSDREINRRRHHRRHHSKTEDKDSYDDSSSDTPNSQDQKVPQNGKKQVRVIEPGKPQEPEVKPKGILKPAREKFPEDPAPIREGVAPLKDAKKDVPPNARWTKIDRKLVNPEALELGGERFEERPDYVIVLRVLTKEEIEHYAEMTMDIREERDKKYREKQRKLKEIEAVESMYEREAPRQLDNRPYEESTNPSYDPSKPRQNRPNEQTSSHDDPYKADRKDTHDPQKDEPKQAPRRDTKDLPYPPYPQTDTDIYNPQSFISQQDIQGQSYNPQHYQSSRDMQDQAYPQPVQSPTSYEAQGFRQNLPYHPSLMQNPPYAQAGPGLQFQQPPPNIAYNLAPPPNPPYNPQAPQNPYNPSPPQNVPYYPPPPGHAQPLPYNPQQPPYNPQPQPPYSGPPPQPYNPQQQMQPPYDGGMRRQNSGPPYDPQNPVPYHGEAKRESTCTS